MNPAIEKAALRAAALLAAAGLLTACAGGQPEPTALRPARTAEEVWTQPLVGSSAAALAASEATEGAAYIERLRDLEAKVAEGVQQGQFTETDLAQVRARRARAEARLAETLGDLGKAQADYFRVIGPPPAN